MTYKDYIDLGFKRVDTNDRLHFEKTGNESFALEFKVNKKVLIESPVTDKPRLYYNHKFMCELTIEQVKQIIERKHDLI
jgi:hypothetical protein